jgi:N-hydroxyarylamine O-acetyltransferase
VKSGFEIPMAMSLLLRDHTETSASKARGHLGLHENLLPDYEVTNWYHSNHPDSRFVTGLLAARPAPDCRYALRNNQLAVHHLNGGTDRRALTSVAEMRATLEPDFRIALPDVPEFDAVLARLTAQAS